MKPQIKKFISAWILLSSVLLLAQDAETAKKRTHLLRFHSGTVLAAELMPEGAAEAPVVKNMSPLEPPSRITSDLAYAAVTVKLDSGRSLSVYDYTLLNKRKDEFKCVGVREGDGDYNYEKWEFDNAKADKLYTMLFKVQLPAFNEKSVYVLRYNLNKAKSEEISIPFIKISAPFTAPSKIPPEGIVGVEPGKTEEPKEEAAAGKPLDTAEAKPVEQKEAKPADQKEPKPAAEGGMKTVKVNKWCSIIQPDKVKVGQEMVVKAVIAGMIKDATQVCAELHCRTNGRVYAGLYSKAQPQSAKADGEFSFKFDIADKDNLESVNVMIYISSSGTMDDMRGSATGPDIPVSGATQKKEAPAPEADVKQEAKSDRKDAKNEGGKAVEKNLFADKGAENFGWRFDNGQEFPGATGKLGVDKDSLKLEGDFTKGGAYVQTLMDLKDVDITELSFEIKYPGATAICMRIGDSGGQCHQINLKLKDSPDWQKISMKTSFIDDRNSKDAQVISKYENWGGQNDGKWHGPAKMIAFLIGPSDKTKTPTMWFKNLKVISR